MFVVNGEAIYETKPVEPFSEGKVAYTAKGDHSIYAIYMPEAGEKELPAYIMVRTSLAGKPEVSLLASKQSLSYQQFDNLLMVSIPKKLRSSLAGEEAVVIKVSKK